MLGRRKTTGKDSLDQRRLGIAPRVPDVDDERNPAIVDDSLQERAGVRTWTSKCMMTCHGRTRARSTALMILSCNYIVRRRTEFYDCCSTHLGLF